MASNRFAVASVVCLALISISHTYAWDKNEDEQPPAPVAFPICNWCKIATTMLDKQFAMATNLTQPLGATLIQACKQAGGLEAACAIFATEFGGLIAYAITVAKFSVDGFCDGLYICPPATSQIMTANGVFDSTCNGCKTVMESVATAMTSDEMQARVGQAVTRICSAPFVDAEECAEKFGASLAQSIETTAQILEPQKICTMLGPCLFQAPVPGKEVDPPITVS